MKTILKFFVTAWIFLFASIATADETSYDILFVGFDTGETNVFAEILQEWKGDQKIGFLTMATSTKVATDLKLKNIIALEQLDLSCPANNRLYQFSPDDLEKIGNTFKTKVLCTGVFSTPQRQIAELLSAKGATVISFWDNFSTFDKLPKDLVQNVKEFARTADHLFTPSQEVADDLNTRFMITHATAMGQPTLKSWENKLQVLDHVKILHKIPLSPKKKIITYMGGYEENGNNYADAFKIFAESIKNEGRYFQLIVQLHPRSDGSFEKTLLESFSNEYSHFPKFFISDSRQNLGVYESAAIAHLVVSHRSTAGIQALFAGKNILYVDVPNSSYSNFAIEKDLAQKLSEPSLIRKALYRKNPQNLDNCYQKAGIPQDSTAKIISFLELILKD
jgi:hypothetical protein